MLAETSYHGTPPEVSADHSMDMPQISASPLMANASVCNQCLCCSVQYGKQCVTEEMFVTVYVYAEQFDLYKVSDKKSCRYCHSWQVTYVGGH